MITLRGIGVFIFSALLTGAAAYSAFSAVAESPQCPPPGALQPELPPPDTKCQYELTIKKIIDAKQGVVLGKVPPSVVDHHDQDCRKHSKDPKQQCPDPKMYQFKEYRFTIDGGASDLREGQDYKFEGIPKTDRLRRTS